MREPHHVVHEHYNEYSARRKKELPKRLGGAFIIFGIFLIFAIGNLMREMAPPGEGQTPGNLFIGVGVIFMFLGIYLLIKK